MGSSSAIKGRRSHRKSRTGCLQCKLRKVKCGEEKPTCFNCIRHGVDCSFGSSARGEMPPQADPLSSASQATTPLSPPGPGPQDNAQSGFPVEDMELLHHFITSTAYTFSRHPVLQTFWRVEVPQIGFTAPYTLRAILALAALHLATLRPEKAPYYIAKANMHHEVALQLATPEIAHMTPENSAAVFMFSALTTFIWCAKPLRQGNFLIWEDHDIAAWLWTIRGTGTILDSADESVFRKGPLALMFSVRGKQYPFMDTGARFPPLEDLHQLVKDEVQDEAVAHLYKTAIDQMHRSFNKCFEGNLRLETSDVFVWLLRVPHDFLLLLKDYQPVAMVIVAYFCVLLHQLEWVWCMKGWSTHLVSQIHSQLGPKYRGWIRWPIEQIGILPTP
ncbi:putative C6 transcription factor [Aspergillus ellipticus CBS 707.79]|uniref:Putative C6 transcription factor n=1 Tax=Aspergillus ellipticus CBS 707.79 TaxID=1448320 RepID=A0A319D0H1_9EURO|nr:putative C6 transcription factor [Aspergillus ellipticus CBS 707.79]